jgi:hypothetical protein
MLPPEAPDPWTPLLATLDCAALPEEVTGLPLPPDGRLLLFGFPVPDQEIMYFGGVAGEVVYIPAGTPVEERKIRYACVYGEEGDDAEEDVLHVYEQFPQEELRLAADIALPHHFTVDSPEPPDDDALPGHPRSWDLAEVWSETSCSVDGPLHIGGYAFHECTETDPVVDAAQDAEQRRRFRLKQGSNEPGDAVELPAPEHWVLLAQWDIGLSGREGSTLHWVIPRQDLAERRFDRAHVSFFWNP